MNRQRIAQGEVWLTRLDPTEGNEIRKTRPCLVVSPEIMNRNIGTVVVIPLTSGSKAAPFRVSTEFRSVPGFLLPEQVRCVSKGRLLKFVGKIDAGALTEALAVLREMFEE